MKTKIIPAIIFIAIIGLSASCSNIKQTDKSYKTKNEVACNNDTCKLIDDYLSKLSVEKNFSGALLIVKNGEKIFSKGYGLAIKEKKIPFTSGTLASMGSITKAFTATAILKLAEQGKLSVTDQLKKYFPEIPSDKANITIHQLLTHSSGFHEFLQNDGGDFEKIEKDEFLKRAFTEPLAFNPGEKAVYTNVGMSILGIIIEQVSGTDYESFLKKYLFEPSGISGIGYHSRYSDSDNIAHGYKEGKDWGTIPQHFINAGGGPFWNLKANGGLEASLNDMFLWINAISNNTILNAASVGLMFTPHIAEEGNNGRIRFGYGCNIQQSRRNTKVVDNGGSNGIYFARLIRYSDEGLIFYMVTNESTINANMVLPNILQLYFQGSITQDALAMQENNGGPLADKIYNILIRSKTSDLGKELEKENIRINNDMILLEAGQRLIKENKTDEALALYQYYTKSFPNIIVAWNDLGDVYQMINNKEEAIRCYKQALTLRPDNQRAKNNLEKLTK